MARLFDVDGRRDIQVLAGRDAKWDFVGKEGRGITGVDHNFLLDAKEGPDGRLWVLAGYGLPSNPQRGWNHFLYCLVNDRWKLVGPANGYPSDMISRDRGLHFLKGNEPIHHLRDNLLRLDGDRWEAIGAQELLRKHPYGQFAWRRNDAWFFVIGRENDSRTLDAYWLRGPDAEDVIGPMRLITDPKPSTALGQFAVSEGGTIAIRSTHGWSLDPNQRKSSVILFTPSGDLKFTMKEYEATDLPWSGSIAWSPKGTLYYQVTQGAQDVQLFALKEGSWQKQHEVAQPVSQGRVFLPKMFFRSDDQPIVVWNDFFPHN